MAKNDNIWADGLPTFVDTEVQSDTDNVFAKEIMSQYMIMFGRGKSKSTLMNFTKLKSELHSGSYGQLACDELASACDKGVLKAENFKSVIEQSRPKVDGLKRQMRLKLICIALLTDRRYR